ncbi:MAG TPA: DNA polymerase III subunit gamma/tau [Candidatus Acidoferrum sp.]|nr:DNA polymerase III subunit gamma/tau [Candidatus Acidoferrum sp.]
MSYKVIARKYRPQTFAEIVGQEHVTRTLANAIQSGRVAHAYIFSGVRGVGKTTTARILAKALNCVKGPTAEPDNTCDACREIANGTSLDVLEIDAASNRGIDQIRELREMVRYAPAASRYKVVILDEAHQLTDEASNALLKTLEEPPEGVVFIMATTQPEDLADTIKSRAQLFQFRALSFQEIATQLENVAKSENLSIEPGAVAVLARAAEGSSRDGLSLLEQAIAYGGDTITDAHVRDLLGVVAERVLDEMIEAIAAQSAERALRLVHSLLSDGQNLQHFCREAIRHVRNLLVARVCGADSKLIAAGEDERPRLAEQSAQFGEEDLTRFFQILLATEDDIRRKPDQRLHLELGLLRLINAQRLAPLEEVLAEIRGGGGAPPRPEPRGQKACVSATAAGSGSSASPFSADPPARSAMSAPAISTPPAAPPASFPGSRGTAVKMVPSEIPPAEKMESRGPISVRPVAAPAAVEVAPAPAIGVAPGSRAAEGASNGSEEAQIEAIKAALQSQKFLWSLLEPATRWEIERGELTLSYPAESRTLADMLQARDPMERLRTVLNQVVGQPVRVCVKLESGSASVGRSAELRARFEEDPIVRAMLEKFGGQISNFRRPGEE